MLGSRFARATLVVAALLVTTACSTAPPPAPDPAPPGEPSGSAPAPDPAPSAAAVDERSASERALDCLPGRWQVDPASPAWDVPAGDADEVSGTFSVVFDGAGGFGLEYHQWRIFTEIRDGTGSSVEVIWDGTLIGEYTVGQDGLVATSPIDSDVTTTSTMTTAGIVETDVTDVERQPVPVQYRCDGDRLTGIVAGEGVEAGDTWVVYDFAEQL
ncbi:hypothetical protein SAMN04487783_0947 [Agrococcus baldri]|uniref:Lipoprotein n=1 Tax=Agrococcus baldri TaxID=153730 RepID=A0AA94HLL3_9MICO|nr:hypothetical protein [Agrococcus baldri]SFS07343.1 hypothetical protein SAMN04487783_0947 [Agrococcus baldri]